MSHVTVIGPMYGITMLKVGVLVIGVDVLLKIGCSQQPILMTPSGMTQRG